MTKADEQMMKPGDFLRKARTAIFTRRGHERVRRDLRQFARLKLADLRCRGGAAHGYFEYLRPDGARFLYLRGDLFSACLYFQKDFELEELLWAARWLAGGGTLIDGGANIGLFTAVVRQKCPLARIEAVECCPSTCDKLRFVIRQLDLKDIRTHLLALGGEDGGWMVNENTTGDSALNQTRKVGERRPDAVGIVTLSRLLGSPMPQPILIKLDLEGGEWDALHGLEDYLRQEGAPRPAILLEINQPLLEERKISMEKFWNWFEAQGYAVFFGGGWGQGPSFGTRLISPTGLPCTFNVIAVGKDADSQRRWLETCSPGRDEER